MILKKDQQMTKKNAKLPRENACANKIGADLTAHAQGISLIGDFLLTFYFNVVFDN